MCAGGKINKNKLVRDIELLEDESDTLCCERDGEAIDLENHICEQASCSM